MKFSNHWKLWAGALLALGHVASGATIQPAKPTVVSLSPNLTELIYTLGLEAHLIGRSSACDYPAEAQTLTVVGDFGRPNAEALRLLMPDLVFLTDLEKPGLIRQMEEAGCRVLQLPCESWATLMSAAREIAKALGAPEKGEAWTRQMEKRRAALQRASDEFFAQRPRPRLFVEIWSDPVTTAGGDTFITDLVTLAGGINIAAAFKTRYTQVSSEWVVQENPDIILLAWMTGAKNGAQTIARRPGWADIKAVKEGALITDIHPDLLLRSGPRTIEGAEALFQRLKTHTQSTTEP